MQAIYKKKLVNVWLKESGVVWKMEFVDSPGVLYFPLIKDGKNVEEFKLIK